MKDIERADSLPIPDKSLRAYSEDAIKGVRGWLSIDEAAMLTTLATKVPVENSIVEIGSFQGRSTCALAAGTKIGYHSKVHAVDTFSGLEGIFPENTLSIFQSNLLHKQLQDEVIIHKGKSLEAAKEWQGNNIGFLFIDADHSYESVQSDLQDWLPHLSPNALIAFHDSNQPGPNKLLREITRNADNKIRLIGLRDSLAILQIQDKRTDNGCAVRKSVWLKYLTILGQDFAKYIENEKIKLKKATLDLLNQAEQSVTKLSNVRVEKNLRGPSYKFAENQGRNESC